MYYLLYIILTLALSIHEITTQNTFYGDPEYQCPDNWIKFQDSCYRFRQSPIRAREDARRNCQAYQSDLVSVNSLEEHGFILQQLIRQDPQHRKWYTGVRLQNGLWVNEADNSQFTNMENAFLPDIESNDNIIRKDILVYSFDNNLRHWGFEKVTGRENYLYICEASVSALLYLVEDHRTYEYGVEIDDPLQIPRGPYFVQQPVSKVFDETKRKVDNDVSLSCLARGYPTPTYEWFKESYDHDRLVATKIDPLQNDKYTISGGTLIIHEPNQMHDRDSYHCKASNEFGTIISETVKLTFGYILEFNLQRSKEYGRKKWGKVINCDPPQNYPSIKYYWARDYFPNFVEEDQRVFVSYDGALYFSHLENVDQAKYSCNVQSVASDSGRNGPFFQLIINEDTSHQKLLFPNNFPKSFPEAAVSGENVRLECMAFGYPVPSYNWTRNGADLPRGTTMTSFNRVLTIPKVQVEDEGEYVCTAYNSYGSISNSLKLSVKAAPVFTIPLADKHVDIDSDFTWTCEAFGIPDVVYDWFKNGHLLEMETLPSEDRGRYFINDNVLTIKSADPERDEGMYQCRAKNTLKTTYSSGQLRVLALKPSFKKHPMESEAYALEGGNTTILCNPESAPRPKFVWKKDFSVIGSGGHRKIFDTGNLMINPVSRDDEGTYACIATNRYGSDETRGRLVVFRNIRFIDKSPNKIITSVMQNQTLRCIAESDERLDLAYTWTFNQVPIKDFENPRWFTDENVFDIINITFADTGDYTCIVKSAVGQINSTTKLIVQGPPGAPGGIQVVFITGRSVTLRWTDSTVNGKPITMYTLMARTNWNQTWNNLVENITTFEKLESQRVQATVENVLSSYATYEFRISAFNEFGYGLPSVPSPKYNTPSDKPNIFPSNIGGGGGKIGDLTITWDPLKPSEQNGPGIYYKVFWRRKHHEHEYQSLPLEEYKNTGKAVIQISSQFYYTEYEVKVQAINDIGKGPISPAVTIFSAEDMPQVAPQLVVARSYNSTCLNVSWNPIEQTREKVRGELIGYRIRYWKQSNPQDSLYYLSRNKRPWTLVVGLQPDTYYEVKVMAYNSAGEGPESERFIERTYRKAPQRPPASVFVHRVNPSTVKVVWRYVQPSFDEEPLEGFKIRVWELDQDMSTAKDTIIPIESKLEAYISDLSPAQSYNLRVLAFSNGGDGRMSSPTNKFQMGDPAAFRSSAPRNVFGSGIFILLLLRIFYFI